MTVATVDRLRPAAMQSRPVYLDGIFDDPEAILRIIEQRSPYVTMAAYHRMEDTLGGQWTQPFFRGTLDEDLVVHNPRWANAARKAFDAQIVCPERCTLNLNAPMAATGVHVDLPVFRGFAAPDAPVWLLMNMRYSGLFHDWMVPIASGLAWFYRGAGGAFVYWPDGPEGAPQVERGPLWNSGVMSDNEFMFHGVGPIGSADDRGRLSGTLRASDKLWFGGDATWEIRDGDEVVHRLASGQVRISLLWKARVFRDEHHLASFEDRAMDLSIGQVVEVYLDDLAARGLKLSAPTDPFNDVTFRKTLEATYPQPLSPRAADELV